MIYLRAELFEALDEPSRLKQALQWALELEHATIPPYMFAAYTLGPVNKVIRNLTRDITREEMLHMTLVCNVLNAIGGEPQLSHPGFIPSYPASLPGAIHGDLIVPLAPFSRNTLDEVFLRIEQPEAPVDFRVMAAPEGVAAGTIGQFYARIEEALRAGGPALFAHGKPDRQVEIAIDDDDSFVVTDVESAGRAIDLIVAQGEGTERSPLDGPNGEPAHYYRFMQIVKGKVLREDASTPEGYSYSGEKIVFDPAAVFPAKTNIKMADIPVDSPARLLAEQFNRDYTGMLALLHRAFNGEKHLLGEPINLMTSALKTAAIQLVQIEIADGVNAGPTFEYTEA